jgi:hypothetical protein
MRLNHRVIAVMLSATALASASAITACAGGGIVYDPYRHDYRRWNHGEDRFYQEWEIETHRVHMDFNRRSRGDQNAYWGWRHR